MTEIWPPAGAIAHFLAVSMCRVTLDTAVDTFATGSYGLDGMGEEFGGAGTGHWEPSEIGSIVHVMNHYQSS